jgi:Ribonuclease G/E
MARIKKMQSGGKSSSLGMKSVKAGFDKNPGVTRADIIVAAKKEAKKGAKVKKAQVGSKVALRTAQLKRVGRLAAKNPDKAEQVGSKMVERATRRQRGKEFIQSNLSKLMPQSKKGSMVKKCKYGCK